MLGGVPVAAPRIRRGRTLDSQILRKRRSGIGGGSLASAISVVSFWSIAPSRDYQVGARQCLSRPIPVKTREGHILAICGLDDGVLIPGLTGG